MQLARTQKNLQNKKASIFLLRRGGRSAGMTSRARKPSSWRAASSGCLKPQSYRRGLPGAGRNPRGAFEPSATTQFIRRYLH